jgi:hypothetical protein
MTMSKQPVKRKKETAPAQKPLEPLLPANGGRPTEAELRDWLKRFDALPLKDKNRVIAENKLLLEALYGGATADGSLLVNALAAENNGDYDKGRHAFLTIVAPLRARLVKDYDLKTGAELMLADVLVMSYWQWLRAARALHSYIAYGKSFNYETLVRYAQTYLARANELFLRNLEALRAMKAAPFTIKIEQAGQVNVGDKQLNVAGNPQRRLAGASGQQRDAPTVVLPDAPQPPCQADRAYGLTE